MAGFAQRPELVALLVLAAVLNLWGLGINGYANDYYAAGVRSMTESWHAFLYGSFDAAGIVTVDKPPLSSWIQALSARAFGFGSWSLLAPQALMGVASVGLLWALVARRFGRVAGFAAGLALAVTPITVAISRHNNPDALLVLCSVAALWALVRGLEDGRTKWLVWAGVFVGLGFEAKMAAALMVVPGIAAAWLYVAPRALARRTNGEVSATAGSGDGVVAERLALGDRLDALKQLLAGGAAMLIVGLAWPVLVWLTPADSRPWVSGTDDNSIWSLILGYNGLGRLFGQSGGPGGNAGAGAGGGPGGGGGGMGGVFGGDTGPLRLLNDALGGQAGWLLGFALLAGAVLLVMTRLRRTDARSGWLIAVGGAWLVTAVAFSKAQGIFHPYYVSLLAPFTAALVGAGVGVMVRSREALAHDSADVVTAWAVRLLGPLAIAGGVVTTLVVLHDHPDSLPWLPPVLVAGALLAAAALLVPRVVGEKRLRAAVVAAVMGLLLLAPTTWAVQTLGHATSSTFPAGGPASASAMGGPGGGGPGG
ncbi:MAG TPA: glycosyltransferase family 39 protein, partial [Solirubrobacteraceae bacterium]|nr:glycosyltransferase family 39 protein [Solirubrobacteraceae bacterium]